MSTSRDLFGNSETILNREGEGGGEHYVVVFIRVVIKKAEGVNHGRGNGLDLKAVTENAICSIQVEAGRT